MPQPHHAMTSLCSSTRLPMHRSSLFLSMLRLVLVGSATLLASTAWAQAAPAAAPTSDGWLLCQAIKDDPSQQLQCFQKWADAQSLPTAPALGAAAAGQSAADTAAFASRHAVPAVASDTDARPAPHWLLLSSPENAAPDGKPIGCRDTRFSPLSRFWELQRGTDCDNFALRGYRPITLAVAWGDSVNKQPTSPASGHSASNPLAYRQAENKISLSVRTKLAKGLFKDGDKDEDDHDSLWFGYSQQSYWQLFTPGLSRPFRSTDHEPELIYIYPHQIPLPGGWNYRLSGVGLVHQSNGQSLPLSRSWNRVYVMGAAEKILGPESNVRLEGRVWERVHEKAADDDNPGIQNFIGRAELAAYWQVNAKHRLGLLVRHSLQREARGAWRLDWMLTPSSSPNYSGLRYHVQLFSGYGDSLIDYNRSRTVLSVGLSLVDW